MICPKCGNNMELGFVPINHRSMRWLPEQAWSLDWTKEKTIQMLTFIFDPNRDFRITDKEGGIFLTGNSQGTGYNDKYESLDSYDPTAAFRSHICKDCELCLIDYSEIITK